MHQKILFSTSEDSIVVISVIRREIIVVIKGTPTSTVVLKDTSPDFSSYLSPECLQLRAGKVVLKGTARLFELEIEDIPV